MHITYHLIILINSVTCNLEDCIFISFQSKIYDTLLLNFRLLKFNFYFPTPQISGVCVTNIIF